MNFNDTTPVDNINEQVGSNCIFIEISHYEDDKITKTETFPMIHFLEGFEKEFKKVRYN